MLATTERDEFYLICLHLPIGNCDQEAVREWSALLRRQQIGLKIHFCSANSPAIHRTKPNFYPQFSAVLATGTILGQPPGAGSQLNSIFRRLAIWR